MSNRIFTRLRIRPLRPIAIGLLLAAIASPTVAGASRIELRDGSVLSGELISVSEGAYRIRSSTLGEIQVRESEVMAIRPLGANGDVGNAGQLGATEAGGTSGGASYKEELAAIQQRLGGDPSDMQAILSRQDNPEIRAALADPAFTQLILSGNVATLSADPRFRRLMENPAIQGILGQIQSP
jgi:hypothetical protein